MSRDGRYFLTVIGLVLLLSASTNAQTNVGIIRGKVTDQAGATVSGAVVRLTNSITDYTQTAVTDSQGAYQLIDVPFNHYRLMVEAKGFSPAIMSVTVRSDLVQQVEVQLPLPSVRQEIRITATGELVDGEQTAPSVIVDQNRILGYLTDQPSRSAEDIVATAPGWTLDANGRLHARGIEYQVQYSVDGIPITDTMASTFASSPDPRNFRSVEVTTSNILAEYGNKLAGVIAVNSRSGLEIPTSGSVTLSGGSFSNFEGAFDLGGHARKFGYFISAAGLTIDRFLDPPALENFHNQGRGIKSFLKFDYTPSSKDLFRFNLFIDGQRFDVPNFPDQEEAGQDQRRKTNDHMESFSWQHIFSPNLVSHLAAYQRYNSAKLRSNVLATPVFAEQSRHQSNYGAIGSLTYHVKRHTLKTGFELTRFPLTESFTFAITDLDAVLEKEPDLTKAARAFTLAQPFLFRQQRSGWEGSIYAQDHINATRRLTLDLGARFDSYHFLVTQNYVSPRLGLAYYIDRTKTVLRASYARFLETPALENLLLSSAAQARLFSPASEEGGAATSAPVRPSREWQVDVGFQQQLMSHLRLDTTLYYRRLKNPPEITNFLETGIIFPATLSRSRSKGIETRLDLASMRGLSGFISYTNLHIYGFAPITGGLFLGEAVDSLGHAGERIKIEEDQRNTVVFEARYDRLPKRAWLAFTGRHDSGYSVELEPGVTRDEFKDEFPDRILNQVNIERGFVRPHTVLNVGIGKDIAINDHVTLSGQFQVLNLTDKFYLVTFESVFSGTTIGRPRSFGGKLSFRFK